MVPEVEYETPSWNVIYSLILNQAKRICSTGFKPEVIIGVSRGGWVPARVLSDLLENPNLANVKTENYLSIGKTRDKPNLTQEVSVNVTGKRVLVVDDVADSGGSLTLLKKHLLEQGASEVKTATLYFKPQSVFKPDFYEKETRYWIVFPWDLKESLRNLVRKYKHNDEDLRRETDKLAGAGVSKQLIARFVKEFCEESC